MKKYIITIALLFLPLLLGFSNRFFEVKESSYLSKDSLSVDTTYVLGLLKLSHLDSLFLNLNSKVDNRLVEQLNIVEVKDSSGKMSPFYIRSILSAIYSESDYSYTGAYLILYVNSKIPSKVEKISRDSIEIYFGPLTSVRPQIFFGDINFDGYKDFFVSFDENTAGYNTIYGYYLFNPEKNIFVEDTTLINIDPISFNEQEETISTGGRTGLMGYSEVDYKWDGSKYVLNGKKNTYENGDMIITIHEELIDGKWEVIFSDTTINK